MLLGPNVKAYDNKKALLKSVLKPGMDPPGGLNLLQLSHKV